MAILTNPDREDALAEFMRDQSDKRQPINIDKNALRALIIAADVSLDNGRPAYDLEIPNPAKASATASQKNLALKIVADKRFKAGA